MSDKNPLISVIVPVYNVASYLPRCIESIQNQTYTNLEIILVNDGSSDDSGRVCDMYAQEDTRIVVVHKENGGSSSARNAGLDIMRGEWFGFVDADDYIDKHMYEKLLASALENDTLLSNCAQAKYYTDGRIKEKINTNLPAVTSGIHYVRLWAENHRTGGRFARIMTRLYNRELLRDTKGNPIRFDTTLLGSEDLLYSIRILSGTDKVSYIPQVLYYYCVRDDSISLEKFNEKKMTWFPTYDKVITIIRNIPGVKVKNVKAFYAKKAFIFLTEIFSQRITDKEKPFIVQLRKYARRYLHYYLFLYKDSIRQKLKYLTLLYRPTG